MKHIITKDRQIYIKIDKHKNTQTDRQKDQQKKTENRTDRSTKRQT